MALPDQTTSCVNSDDKFVSGLESFTSTSIEYLNGILLDPEPFKMLTYDSFVPLDEASFNRSDNCNGQKFDKFVIISKTELKTQIYYDLCSYYIYTKKYDLAKEMASMCKTNLAKLKEEFDGEMTELKFCNINEQDLKGYLLACGIFEQNSPSLFQRFNECLLNDRTNLESILNEDNYKREIPFVHRKTVECSIDVSSTEYIRVLALNSICYTLDKTNIISNDIPFLLLRNNAHRNLLLKYFIQVYYYKLIELINFLIFPLYFSSQMISC